MIVPTNFDLLTMEQVKQLLNVPDCVAVNRPFIMGDHLQGGDAWVGPGPRQNHPRFGEFFQRLEVVFAFKNVTKEVCERLVSAIAGREPRWSWAPRRVVTPDQPLTDAEKAAKAELELALTEWWDARQVHDVLEQLLMKMLWATRGVVRCYVPAAVAPGGRVGSATLEEALKKIYLDVPEPEHAYVYEHPDTRQLLGIVVLRDQQQRETVELTFLDPNGKTVIKILDTDEREALDFGERLPILQVTLAEPLITTAVLSLQKQLNMTLTLLGKGMVDTHFLERLFIDILAPGKYTVDQDGQRTGFVPDPTGRVTGDRTDSYLQSIDYQDEGGVTRLAEGKIVLREPIDPSFTIKSAEYWYQALLEEVRQDHILINQSATPSGKSRDEARQDFVDSGNKPQQRLEALGRMLLWSVVSMAEAFMQRPGLYTSQFKPVFKCNARYGRLSVEERKQNMDEADHGFLSIDTAMTLNGVDDVDAERAIVDSQPGAKIKLSQVRAEAVVEWSTEFPRLVALWLAGYTDDEIQEILTRCQDAQQEDTTEPDTATPPQPHIQQPAKPVMVGNG